MRCSSLARLCVISSVVSLAACGLRSDPFAPGDVFLDSGSDTESDPTGDPGDPNRAGTCNNPLGLPFMPTTLAGTLSGPSFQEGWCGSDGGPEDVYTLVPDYDVDVTITMNAALTEFTPTLRVIEDGCANNTGFDKVCTRNVLETPYHFLAQAGRVYSVIIDSSTGTEGDYSFRVDYGFPPLALCPVHPEVVKQIPGSAFVWNNDFSQGQGRVDGYCGGPGRENMFRIDVTYPGSFFARAQGTGGFAPVLSFRTDCAAISELACNAAAAGGVAELGGFFPQAGVYYLVVDQGEIGDGGYELRIDFE